MCVRLGLVRNYLVQPKSHSLTDTQTGMTTPPLHTICKLVPTLTYLEYRDYI